MNGLNELLNELRTRESPRLWVLIDAAGLPDGRASIDESRFEQLECLFTGDLEVELADVAPYLGLLNPSDPDTKVLLEHLVNIDCAVLLTDVAAPSELTFSQAHRHLRKFNVVYGPQGNPLFFRYYDPRVLPGVLSVLTEEQLQAFFGPFDAIHVRALNSDELAKLQVASGQLMKQAA